jgi:hypothetical protein
MIDDYSIYPTINFPPDWDVRIVPSRLADIKFHVLHSKGYVSVFADYSNKLGVFFKDGEPVPYWEVYPINGDVGRCEIHETGKLIELISESIRQYGV